MRLQRTERQVGNEAPPNSHTTRAVGSAGPDLTVRTPPPMAALTTVMKSPWLHPAAVGEFGLAACMVICGAILFAYFVGNVTAVITASTAASGRYRDTMSMLRNFALTHRRAPHRTCCGRHPTHTHWSACHGQAHRAAPRRHLHPARPSLIACPD